MKKTDYRGFLSEEIVEKSAQPGVDSRAVRYQGDTGGDDLIFDWNCVTQPTAVEEVLTRPDRDQFILFAGSDLDNLREFGAKVRLCLGPEKTERVITEPKLVYVPRGLTCGPITFAEVDAPIVWMNFSIAPQLSRGWTGGSYDDCLVTPNIMSHIFHTKTTVNGNLLYEQSWPEQQMVILGDAIGPDGANFCMFYYAVTAPYYMTEPAHAHARDMWLINLGGDPRKVEEFDAEVTMWWGEEAEKLVMDTTSVAHVPPGLLHRGLFFDQVRRPFVHIHAYTAPGPDKDVVVAEHPGVTAPSPTGGSA